MPVTNYYSVNGRIVGQKVSGQPASARVDYVTDALGSVVATADQRGAVQNRYAYKPYGGLLAKTGAAPDPAFTWVGSQGYRQTAKKYSDVYIRARHYGSGLGRWTTKDPIGIADSLNKFQYAYQNPPLYNDPSGLQSCGPSCCCSVTSFPQPDILSQVPVPPTYPGVFLASKITYHVDLKFTQLPPGQSSSDCQLQYFEKTNVRDTKDVNSGPTGFWHDMYPSNTTAFTFKVWTGHATPCPGSDPLTFIDVPLIKWDRGVDHFNGIRKLCIRVVISNGAGCPGSPQVHALYQVINTQTKTVYARRGIDPEGYCRWP